MESRVAVAPEISHSRPSLELKDRKAIEEVLDSEMIAEGTQVRRFEREVSRYLDVAGGIAMPSGAGAIYLALKALDIGPDAEVVLPTYVCNSVRKAVRAVGAQPVLCDVGHDWCVNEETIRSKLSTRTKAIIVVHTFGIVADLNSIFEEDIPVIEDCCHAFGARDEKGRLAGTRGDFCVLSFHATKLLTTGEGGMLLATSRDLIERARFLNDHSSSTRTGHLGLPMSNLQAALGLSQLARYNFFLRRRLKIAEYYFNQLKNLTARCPESIRKRSIFFRFPLRVKKSFSMISHAFSQRGIHVRRGVDTLLHCQSGGPQPTFPGAEKCFDETLCLPIYPALQTTELERISKACHEIFRITTGQ